MEVRTASVLKRISCILSENKLAIVLVVVAVLIRFLPQPANFAPIGAIALFGGVYLKKNQALLLPLVIMIISDLFIGLHSTIFFTWGSFLLIAAIGILIKNKKTVGNVLGATILGSIIFFIVTNLGVWAITPLYSKNLAGLIECYQMAIPFFRNTLLSDLLYVPLFFGAYELAKSFQQKFEKNYNNI